MCDSRRRSGAICPKFLSLSFSLFMYIINVYVFTRSLSLSLNAFLKRSLSLSAGGKRRFWRKVFPPALWKNIKRAFKFVRSLRGKTTRGLISIRVLRNSFSLAKVSLSKSVVWRSKNEKISLSSVLCFFLAGGFFVSPLFKKRVFWVLFRVIHAFKRERKSARHDTPAWKTGLKTGMYAF